MKIRIRYDTMEDVYYLEKKSFLLWHILAAAKGKQEIFEKAKLYRSRGSSVHIQEWKV